MSQSTRLILTVLGYFAPWKYWRGGGLGFLPAPLRSMPQGADRRENLKKNNFAKVVCFVYKIEKISLFM